MTTRNKNFEANKYAQGVDKLVEKTNKDLNLSNSDESYEEYTQKELEYIDKYKPKALYRMEDQELYEIITMHRFNDEKIENEIKEFVKLINLKGDDYGWTVIDEGKKKKLFINDKSSKKYQLNNKNNKDEENYRGYDSYNYNKKYHSSNKYNLNYNNSNYNKNFYNKKNYYNTEEQKGNKDEDKIEEASIQNNNEESTSYYNNNYCSSYNTYRGARGKRGRGFTRGRGRYRINNYSREDCIFEKEFGNDGKETNAENKTKFKDYNCNNTNDERAEMKESDLKEIDANGTPEENFTEQVLSTQQIRKEEKREIGIIPKLLEPENKEKIVKYETIRVEEIFENPDLITANKKSVVNIAQNTNNYLEICSQVNKNSMEITSAFKDSIKENNNKNSNKLNYHSFSEIVRSNVQNFSFLSNVNNNQNQTSNNNSIESSSNLKYAKIQQQINSQEFSIPSHQINNTNSNPNNKNENKFDIHNNNNLNQSQVGLNKNYQDFYANYQMQLSALLAQNMTAGINPQQLYSMPMAYYPPGPPAGNASDPSLNYSNFMPYMNYPIGYYFNSQQTAQQQQSNLKDGSEMQNKNKRTNNNFDFNNQHQTLQNAPYSPYMYMNSQYSMNAGEAPMNLMNQAMGMNMIGYNFEQMNSLNQMNVAPNFDPQGFNQKK